MKTTSIQDQISSAIVHNFNVTRIQDEISQLNLQDTSYIKAISEVDKVRDFIGDPSKILGSPATKHGEIAEQVEVGIRRAQDALHNRDFSATFEGVGRTAPEDYLINDIAVQSKFINGLNNNLNHVLEHMNKYSHFGRDGSFYHIPKDHFETILKIYHGENVEGLSQKTINAIHHKISEIETQSGRSFTDVVQPGISKYAEVQQGTVTQTLDRHEQELKQQNEELKQKIHENHSASLSEGLKAAGVAAAVGGALALGTSLYLKYKDGKNIFKGELSAEDWQEIGLNTGQTAIAAGITGSAVYALTNCVGLSAPIAGAFVTAVKGVSSLVQDLHHGHLTFAEFQMNAIYLCADSAGVGLAALMGQTFMPIPVVGAVIGSLAGKLVCNILLGEDPKLAKQMEESMQVFLSDIDQKYHALVSKITAEFDHIKDLRKIAFDLRSNINLVESSINLARAHGVKEHKILKNEEDLKAFLFD